MGDQQSSVGSVRGYDQAIKDFTRAPNIRVSQKAILTAGGVAFGKKDGGVGVRVIQNLSATALAWKIDNGVGTDIDLVNEDFFVLAACSAENAGDGGEVNLSWCKDRIVIKAVTGDVRASVLECVYI